MLSQEYFHTVEPIKKKVSKEEFQTFLDNYPRKLTYDWTGIFEPPAISYKVWIIKFQQAVNITNHILRLIGRWRYSAVYYIFFKDG